MTGSTGLAAQVTKRQQFHNPHSMLIICIVSDHAAYANMESAKHVRELRHKLGVRTSHAHQPSGLLTPLKGAICIKPKKSSVIFSTSRHT